METLMVNTSTGNYLIDTNTIIRIEASSNYSRLFFTNGKTLVTAKVLKWFEEKLHMQSFTRLHRSHLINNRFMQINKSIKCRIQMQDGKIVQVSRRRKKYVLQKFATSCLLFIFLSQTIFSQNVGINTTTPLAMLHVKDSSVLFSGAANLPGTPGNPPDSGAGIRMMWYPDKAAFRAGNVSSTQWNKGNIGNYSFACGRNNTAAGTYSTATGFNTVASGIYSTATGATTEATGSASTAMGNQTNATGSYSTSMGFLTNARPYASLVIGRYNDSVSTSSLTTWVSTDPVFMIGNGSSTINPNNAFVVYKNGETIIDGKLTLNSGLTQSGKLTLNGELALNGELTRPSTGANNNLIPVCYGSVAPNGTINSGTSNFSVTTAIAGSYSITITNETYTTTGYTTLVTVVPGFAACLATTGGFGGDLKIYTFFGDLQPTALAFHFVVYKH